MASVVGDTSCAIHADRHAGARCPQCKEFYCNECITEHEGRLICAACLSAPDDSTASVRKRTQIWSFLSLLLQATLALMICWLIFFLFAQTLGDMPNEFHDGTIWE